MNTIILACFDPYASAYWLPDVGRQTAARIPTRKFWALRANLARSRPDYPFPQDIFLLSGQPSPYPFSEATMTIGPKRAYPSRKLLCTDAELSVAPPLPATNDSPLYLHTVPRLRCHFASRIKEVLFRFDGDHLEKFVATAYEALRLAREFRLQGHRAFQREVLGQSGISKTRPLPIPQSLAYVFGELHDPKAFVFKFGPIDDLTYPEMLEPTLVYEHILIYKQIGKARYAKH
ncbi:uncharacterized protein TRAVEDRAFT_51109 [Trametes versicolor FP-101664 SS1]|uniref:uncharacterized protein n=1 Tax=Trametes versicolor (strain FP-101664) TaxID=717944 RepID=UPI000462138D|nr:uncharacterized protein TRAVEDRAFT_51109 [Trametes versicolor FP-101664 SS1]EIW54981.1 hypothetical protein TRAVEDRAFT_51109 [Trametes versicolor FP-101664 SS1]